MVVVWWLSFKYSSSGGGRSGWCGGGSFGWLALYLRREIGEEEERESVEEE